MRDCTIRVAKTKALISFAVTAKLICVFVFAYAKCWFSHDAAQMFIERHGCCQLSLVVRNPIRIFAFPNQVNLKNQPAKLGKLATAVKF